MGFGPGACGSSAGKSSSTRTKCRSYLSSPARVTSSNSTSFIFAGRSLFAISVDADPAFGPGITVQVAGTASTQTISSIVTAINSRLVSVGGASYANTASQNESGNLVLTSPTSGPSSSITLSASGVQPTLMILGLEAGTYYGS